MSNMNPTVSGTTGLPMSASPVAHPLTSTPQLGMAVPQGDRFVMSTMNKPPTDGVVMGVAQTSPMMVIPQPALGTRPAHGSQSTSGSVMGEARVLDKRRLQELVKEVDPLEQLDDDVEEVLLQIADDFIESIVTSSCQIAKHRKSNVLEVKDVQLHLERNWNMWVPGFGSDDLRPYKKAYTTEAHKQRMALIRKTLKKY